VTHKSSAISLAVDKGDKPAQKEVQFVDRTRQNDDVSTDVNLAGYKPRNTGSRSRVATESQPITSSGVPENVGNLVHNMPSRGRIPGDLHDTLQEGATPSLLPRPRVSGTGASDSLHATQTQPLQQTALTQQPIAATTSSLPRAHVAAPVVDLPLPQTPPDTRGVRTPSSARLPIFDSDSDDGATSCQMAKCLESTSLKPEDSLVTHIDSNGITDQRSPDRPRSTSHHPVIQEPNQVAHVDRGLPAMGNGKPDQGSAGDSVRIVCTPRHNNLHRLEDTPRPHGHVCPQSEQLTALYWHAG